MTTTKWNVGLNGSWTVGANWSAGVPNSGTDVTIGTFGNYTVTLSGQASANSLTVDAAGAILSETAAGTLNDSGALTLEAGTVVLRSVNTIGSVLVSGGLLETGNNTALGTGELTMTGGELLGIANETYTNQMALSNTVVFAAAHGITMTEDASSWSYDATNGGSIVFGQGANSGTVIWKTESGTITDSHNYTAEVLGGTFEAGDSEWSFVFSQSGKSQIVTSATLDTNGFAGELDNLQGAGTLTDSGAAATLFVTGGGNFVGAITGALALDLTDSTLVLTGTSTYTGLTTVESGATLQLGNGGTTGSITGDVADAGTLIYDRAGAIAVTADIGGAGNVTYEGGTGVTINRSEDYTGTTTVNSEKVSTNNISGLGSGSVALNNSELVVTSSGTMSYTHIGFTGNSTFAAAHGKTVTLEAVNTTNWELNANGAPATINIGDATNDGTVIWTTGAGSTVADIGNAHLVIQSGALVAGDSSFGFLTGDVADVTVDAGATLNVSSFGATLNNLSGAGIVIGHADASIGLAGANFSGLIEGDVSLAIYDGTILSGDNTYTRGTTINSGSALSLGNGGTTGSVVGNIVDNGTLLFDHSDNINETATISGSGAVTLLGSGTVTMSHAETYTGGTNIGAGELSIAAGSFIGTGPLSLSGGEFLTTGATSITAQLSMSNSVIIAAATGTQANFNAASGWTLDATNPAAIQFGDGTNDGTILFHTPAGSSIIHVGNYTVDVDSGVLKAADGSLGFLLDDASSVTVASGANINMNGFENGIANLQGAGTVGNSGGATSLILEGGNFAGAINGNFSEVDIYGTLTLSSGGFFAGNFAVENGATLDLAGHWAQDINFISAGAVTLSTPGQWTGHFEQFQAGDTIDIRGVNETAAGFTESYNVATGVLRIGDGTHSTSVIFDGTYDLGNFAPSADGHNGTEITFAAAEMPAHPVLASEYIEPHGFI